MPIPNGAGGYQLGDGNLNDPIIDLLPDPVILTTATTLTSSQLLNGLIIVNNGIVASVNYTLPTVAALEAELINSERPGTSFSFRVVNLGTTSGTAVIVTNTGWTISGTLTMTIPVTTGASFIARKSAAGLPGPWTLYRVA